MIYTDQPIFDAIAAATQIDSEPDGIPRIVMSATKFIEVFNNHRDRALCTSLNAPAQCAPSIVEVASVIHDARFGPDYPENLRNSFDTECSSGRAYCIKLARAVMSGFQLSHNPAVTSTDGCRPWQQEPSDDEKIDRAEEVLSAATSGLGVPAREILQKIVDTTNGVDSSAVCWLRLEKIRKLATAALSALPSTDSLGAK